MLKLFKMNTEVFGLNLENFLRIGNYSICNIECNKTFGTGFFVKLSIPSKNEPMYGLITNNHVLNSRYLHSNFTFKICMENIYKKISIGIDNSKFIFTSDLLDVTFIQFTDALIEKEKLNKRNFLCLCNKECSIDDNVHIIQYGKDKNSYFSGGKIHSLHGLNYIHSCSTQEGSSGSPLLNTNLEVIGIHKRHTKRLLEYGMNVNI